MEFTYFILKLFSDDKYRVVKKAGEISSPFCAIVIQF